ncbi:MULTISPECIES: putative quinol monooxygenase [Hyphomicrobiales]|uniref:putative quinol monooxygenase n=1 Tax=Hyphomicrobiales TaxID=356 RepID=UPI0014355346|nr:putative quinol monooxygenase [[Ochrobactrum] soli]
MADTSISLIAFQYPKPEKRDELEARLKELAKASALEQGCLAYELSTLADNNSVFVFYERWASQADLDRHFNGETFQAFWNERMTYLTKDVEVKILQSV